MGWGATGGMYESDGECSGPGQRGGVQERSAWGVQCEHRVSEVRVKHLRMVEVEWVDSCVNGGWRTRQEYLEAPGVSQCRTVGYLLRSSRQEVIVVQSLNNYGGAADSMTIPRSSVKKIRCLEAKE